MNEVLQIDYLQDITYNNTAENTVGAGTTTGLRTVPSPGGDIAYVRKFGTDYEITEVTDIEDPVDGNMTSDASAVITDTITATCGTA